MRARRQVQQHDDSTWKIVYMDMITVLMVMFLTLWLAGKKLPEKDKTGGCVVENRITIPADDFFDSGHAVLKPEARTRIGKIFLDSESRLPSPGKEGRDRVLYVVEGYTDDIGEKNANFELGFNRAVAVYNELNISGKIPDFSKNVSICSHADNKPWRPEKGQKIESSRMSSPGKTIALTPELARKRNRRVSVKLETIANYFTDTKDELEE